MLSPIFDLLLRAKQAFWRMRGLIVVGVVLIIAAGTGPLPLIFGDGAGYYFNYRQIKAHNWRLAVPEPPFGYTGSYVFIPATHGYGTFYQVGAPLVWAGITSFFPHVSSGAVGRYAARTGKDITLLKDELVLLAASVVASMFLIGVLLRLLDAHFSFRGGGATFAVLAVFFGTPAWYYAFHAPAYSHLIETTLLTMSLAVLLSARLRRDLTRPLLIGALVGIAAMVRLDALLFLPAYALVIVSQFRTRRMASLLALCGPTLFLAGFQFMIWRVVAGTWFPGAYTTGDLTLFPLHTADVLFSGMRGLFIWSPVAVFGVYGLFLALKKNSYHERLVGLCGVVTLLLFALFYGSWHMWWGGGAVGQRFLAPLYPYLVLGIAFLFLTIRQQSLPIRFIGYGGVMAAVLFFVLVVLWYPPPFIDTPLHFEPPTAILRHAASVHGFPDWSSFGTLFQKDYAFRVVHYFTE